MFNQEHSIFLFVNSKEKERCGLRGTDAQDA